MRLLIYGYGRLGRTIKEALEGFAEIKVYSRSYKEVSEKEFSTFDYIFLAIPEKAYPEALVKIKENAPNALVIDAASTKERVIPLLKKFRLNYVSIHPLFGHLIFPEFSPIVVLKVGSWESEKAKKFYELLRKASFVLEFMDLEEHKERITKLQTISHFLLLAFIDYFKEEKTFTALALALRRLAERVLEQNPEVIFTIQQRGSKYREEFLNYLQELHLKLFDQSEFNKIFEKKSFELSRAYILNYAKLFDLPKTLNEARFYLDIIDKLILDLINLRLKIGKEVIAEEKRKKNLPIYNEKAELRRLNKMLRFANERNLNPLWTKNEINLLIQWTKEEEYAYLGTFYTIGVLGPIGSFSDEAALRLFGSRYPFVYFNKVSEIIRAVSEGEIDLGLVPIENVLGGTVSETIDALLKYDVKIIAEYWHPINLVLAAKKEMPLDKVERVLSHPQAISQASGFLERYLPRAEIVFTRSTSEAASLLRENDVAILSEEAAIINNLVILARNIQDNKENKTRFILVSKKGYDDGKVTALFFTTEDKPGALKEVLEVFSQHGVNLRKLESRPDRRNIGKYVFYVEAEAKLGNEVLDDLKGVTDWYKLLGSFVEINSPQETYQLLSKIMPR